jgi:hypothetical protein
VTFFGGFAAEQKQKRRRIIEAAVVPPSPARRSRRLAKLPEVNFEEVSTLFYLRCMFPSRLKVHNWTSSCLHGCIWSIHFTSLSRMRIFVSA